jgi:hypothetical protein
MKIYILTDYYFDFDGNPNHQIVGVFSTFQSAHDAMLLKQAKTDYAELHYRIATWDVDKIDPAI